MPLVVQTGEDKKLPQINALLRQGAEERATFDQALAQLCALTETPEQGGGA